MGTRRAWIAWASLLAGGIAAGPSAGCDDTNYVIDPFEVSVDYSPGVPRLYACPSLIYDCEAGGALTAVIDTGTPLTVVDPVLPDGTPTTRRATSLDLLSAFDVVARARFTGVTPLVSPMGDLGLDGATMGVDVVVGGDVLSRIEVRLDPIHSRAFFFPNLAGSDSVLGRECSAVFPTVRGGGGKVSIDGGEVTFAPTRLVIGACMNPDQPRRPATRPLAGGSDATLVLATGLPVTVLSRSAYERARTATDPAFEALPASTLHLPGAPPGSGEAVRLGSLAWLALDADEVVGEGPCQELFRSRMMDLGGCLPAETICPIGSDERSGASVEVAGPIQVAVVEDSSPLLQGLRAELAPKVADIDGVLGMNAIGTLVTDIDYPGARVVFRCSGDDGDQCVARPRLGSLGERKEKGLLLPCLGKQSWLPTP